MEQKSKSLSDGVISLIEKYAFIEESLYTNQISSKGIKKFGYAALRHAMPGSTLADKIRYEERKPNLDAEALDANLAYTVVVEIARFAAYTVTLAALSEIYLK